MVVEFDQKMCVDLKHYDVSKPPSQQRETGSFLYMKSSNFQRISPAKAATLTCLTNASPNPIIPTPNTRHAINNYHAFVFIILKHVCSVQITIPPCYKVANKAPNVDKRLPKKMVVLEPTILVTAPAVTTGYDPDTPSPGMSAPGSPDPDDPVPDDPDPDDPDPSDPDPSDPGLGPSESDPVESDALEPDVLESNPGGSTWPGNATCGT